jgi:hypothetical protein
LFDYKIFKIWSINLLWKSTVFLLFAQSFTKIRDKNTIFFVLSGWLAGSAQLAQPSKTVGGWRLEKMTG